MEIVFNVNKVGLEGLGSTLTSLIRNCSNNKELNILFLCSDLELKDKNNIRKLFQHESYNGTTKFIDFNAKQLFGHLKSLHGDWTTYGRLLIPELVKSDSALYLDSDLIIQLDILALKNLDCDNIVAAVCASSVQWALDNVFLINKLDWHPDIDYFNAGVIVFNLKKWRELNIDKKIIELTKKYPDDLISNDQTLLNAVSKGQFTHLEKKFNVAWNPSNKRPENSNNAIIHFVGSPKPWDLFGKNIHKGFFVWKSYNTIFWKNQYNKVSLSNLERTWKIRRSLIKTILSAIKN